MVDLLCREGIYDIFGVTTKCRKKYVPHRNGKSITYVAKGKAFPVLLGQLRLPSLAKVLSLYVVGFVLSLTLL